MKNNKKKECKVSVLVTFFNQIRYIDEAINSILSQKCSFEYEILCGDDGSTDGTYEKLLTYQANYPDLIKVFQMPRDLEQKYEAIIRVSENRKMLFSKAVGDYIIFLDGDDYFCDDSKLQRQVDFLENHDCVMCGHSVLLDFGDHKNNQVIGTLCKKDKVVNANLYWINSWIHSEAFMFRNVIKEGKTTLSSLHKFVFDDNTITAFFLQFGKMGYINHCMVSYRQVDGSSWNNRNSLQKAYVNTMVYTTVKEMCGKNSFSNILRHYFALKEFYKNRKKDIIENVNDKFELNDDFYRSTVEYCNQTKKKRVTYELKYFIPFHLGFVVRVLKKISSWIIFYF